MILHSGFAELKLSAHTDELPRLCSWLESIFEEINCPQRAGQQILVCTDEIFNNIASYAYPAGGGEVTVKLSFNPSIPEVQLSFIDRGIAFDPLQQKTPDTTVPLSMRKLGGLGIIVIRKMMDSVTYCRENDCNVLTLTKRFTGETK